MDPENRRLGFEFHADERDDDYTLSAQGTSNKSMWFSSVGINSQCDWVKSVAYLRSRTVRRFALEKEGEVLVVQLCPAFETKVASNSSGSIVPDAVGVYRYVRRMADRDEIVYIGQGKIRARLDDKSREDWDVSRVEYSIVKDDDERKKWESFWLERFKRDHNGKLPLYNLISGKANTG